MALWVVGDLHGCYDEFMEMKAKIEHKDPEAELLLLGDIVDRGPKVKELLDWAVENVGPEKRYQMVLGNHEHMVIQDYWNMRINQDTFSGALDDISIRLRSRYGVELEFKGMSVGEFAKYIKFFKSLPLYRKLRVNGTDYVIAHAWYAEGVPEQTLLWFRDVGAYTPYRVEYKSANGEILIHGHTPTIFGECTQYGAVQGKVWDKGDSINLDCGLVYRIQGPKAEPYCHGNLAVMNLETREILYLFE